MEGFVKLVFSSGKTPHALSFARYLDGKLFEWTKSFALLTIGVAMLIWPAMAHGSILTILVGVLTGVGTALFFIVVGLAGILALVANGSSLKIGPFTRATMASIRAVIWTTFTLSMLRVSLEQGFPSPMVFFFGIFISVEVYVTYRAVLDVRTVN